jgi:antitoxin FitA
MISNKASEGAMAQFVVRNIENAVKARLRRRAKRNGRSMEEEIRDILRSAVNEEDPAGGLGTEISGLFAKVGLESDILELRGHDIKPASFEQ